MNDHEIHNYLKTLRKNYVRRRDRRTCMNRLVSYQARVFCTKILQVMVNVIYKKSVNHKEELNVRH